MQICREQEGIWIRVSVQATQAPGALNRTATFGGVGKALEPHLLAATIGKKVESRRG